MGWVLQSNVQRSFGCIGAFYEIAFRRPKVSLGVGEEFYKVTFRHPEVLLGSSMTQLLVILKF